jgi:hypothetical protein
VPGAPQPVDPLTRDVSVGEYNTMIDTVSDVVGHRDYKSYMRDIFVYDERRDDFSRITLRNALKACCRFNDAGELWFPPGFSGESDPFITADGDVVRVFGDMRAEYMSDDTLLSVAESVVAKFYEWKYNRDENCKDEEKCENWEDWAKKTKLTKAGAGDGELSIDKLRPFFEFVKRILPESRVFDASYIPKWRKNEGDMGGFFYNTIGKLGKDARKDNTSHKSPFGDLDTDNAAAFFGTDKRAALKADGTIDWALVQDKFTDLLSADDKETATASEEALTKSTVDKFIVKMSLLGKETNDPTETGEVLKTLFGLASAIANLKKEAASWLKHFQFVVHKGLLIIAEVPIDTDDTNMNKTIENFVNEVLDKSKEAVLRGPVKGVNKLFENSGVPSAKSDLPGVDPDSAGAPYHPFIGAFDVPAANARFGSGHSGMAPPAKKARFAGAAFGAVLAHGKGTRRGADAEGWDDEDAPGDVTKVVGYSRTMAERYADVRASSSYKTLVKSVMLTFLHTPVTETTLMTLIDRDVYLPFEFLLFRPRITHAMATGILLKAGAETGETLVGHADFQVRGLRPLEPPPPRRVLTRSRSLRMTWCVRCIMGTLRSTPRRWCGRATTSTWRRTLSPLATCAATTRASTRCRRCTRRAASRTTDQSTRRWCPCLPARRMTR